MIKKMVRYSGLMLLASCSTSLPMDVYLPQNHIRYTGIVQMGEFNYIPYQRGLVKSNRIKRGTGGGITLSKDIALLVERNTALELEKTGVSLGDSQLIITGEIQEFRVDDFGFNAEFSYLITYKLLDSKTSKIILNKTVGAYRKGVGKFSSSESYVNLVNSMILEAYMEFITDDEVRKIIKKQA